MLHHEKRQKLRSFSHSRKKRLRERENKMQLITKFGKFGPVYGPLKPRSLPQFLLEFDNFWGKKGALEYGKLS